MTTLQSFTIGECHVDLEELAPRALAIRVTPHRQSTGPLRVLCSHGCAVCMGSIAVVTQGSTDPQDSNLRVFAPDGSVFELTVSLGRVKYAIRTN
jgi:hypothetical protein